MKLREFNPAAAVALVPFWEILLILLGLAATLGVLFRLVDRKSVV